MLKLIIGILIGYIIGSINPAWIFGKVLKGIDIRTVGSHNAGTANAYHILGTIPAVVTGLFDLVKGLLAIGIAWWLGIPAPWYFLAGIAAFLGHIFPFYLNFRGGQGAMTLAGIILFLGYEIFRTIPLPYLELLSIIFIAFLAAFITRDLGIIGIVDIPLVWLGITRLLIIYPSEIVQLVILLLIFVYLWTVGLYNTVKKKSLVLKAETKEEILHWRTIARPVVLLFPILSIYTSKMLILWILGAICFILIVVDLIRLIFKNINLYLFNVIKVIFKKKDRANFSSITYFFVAAFLAILLFEQDIALLAITFVTFGDVAAKFFGAQYSKHFVVDGRSLEGALGYLGYALFFGAFLGDIFLFPLWMIVLGALIAALTDMFSVFIIKLDDNFVVTLVTGGILQGIGFFVH